MDYAVDLKSPWGAGFWANKPLLTGRAFAERLPFGATLFGRVFQAVYDLFIWLFAAMADSSFDNTKDNGAALSVTERAGQIIDLYGNSILRLAYSYLHNMSDAEDILQDTLIQYLKTAPEFEGQDHEKAWLLKVAANLARNRIKYNKYRETDELMEELVADTSEDLSFVWEAVKQLPEKYREVVHLFYEEGLSTREIAEVLERKEDTVRSDLLRGRDKSKIILKEDYDFE